MSWSVLQSSSAAAFGGGGTPSGPLIGFTSTTTAGSLLVCTVNVNDDTLTSEVAVSDPVNGAWTLVAGASWHGASGSRLAVAYFPNAASLSTSQKVSVKWGDSGGNPGAATIIEVSTIATSSPLDPATYTTSTGTSANSSGTSTSPSLTTTVDNDFYVVVVGSNTTVTYTTPTGWTLAKNPSGAGISQATYYLTSTTQAHGTVSVTVTDSASPIDAWMVAFQPSGGAAAGPIGRDIGPMQNTLGMTMLTAVRRAANW